MDISDMAGGGGRATALELQAKLEQTLSVLLRRGTRAALINYPNHHNVGDPALYLGTLRTLRRIGVRLTYRCQHDTYSRDTLAAELRRGTEVILINGGGNLGDQYPQQTSRERVLAEFPTVPTIQLSQSIWFESRTRLESFAELASRNRELTLLLRDRHSLELAQQQFAARAQLCPDMAFGLGPLRRPAAAVQDVLWLKRSDREATTPGGTVAAHADDAPVDWLHAPVREAVGGWAGEPLLQANRLLARQVGRAPFLWRGLAWTFVPLARRRLDFGSRLLARGRVVVTDRLHGVVLALLMDIPVVAVDNRNGKVSSFVSTWLTDSRAIQLAATHETGLALAEEWLHDHAARTTAARR